MEPGKQEPAGLVRTHSAALSKRGTESLAARGRDLVRDKEEAEGLLRSGLELQSAAPPYTPPIRKLVGYVGQIKLGNDPDLVAKSLGLTREDQEAAHTLNFFFPSFADVEWTAQEPDQVDRQNALRADCLREAFQCFNAGIALDPNHPELQFELARCHENGWGTARDHEKEFSLKRLAAEQGHVDAQNWLGCTYCMGCRVQKSDAEAMQWWRKAAEQGHAVSQLNLGRAYLEGWGIAKDHEQAVYWLTRAAQQGHSDAQDELGKLAADGAGQHVGTFEELLAAGSGPEGHSEGVVRAVRPLRQARQAAES